MNKLTAALVVYSILAFGSAKSFSTPIEFTFDIRWVVGALAGNTSQVFITLEGYTGTGSESFNPLGTNSGRALEEISAEVNSVLFRETDDMNFPAEPIISTLDGAIETLHFRPINGEHRMLVAEKFGTCPYEICTVYSGLSAGPSGGFVEKSSWRIYEPSEVPSPPTLLLLTLGLAALRFNALKRRKSD
jgi:hypothetical protein